MEGVRCEFASCCQHDFLPFTCEKCHGKFCLEHRSYFEHCCPSLKKDEKNTDSSEKGMSFGQSVMSMFDGVLKRFDSADSPKVAKQRVPVTSHSPAKDDSTLRAENKMNDLNSITKNESKSSRERNISSKTRQMLMKTKATGNKNIPMDYRFYINLHFQESQQTVPMYFTKVSVLGEVLEKLARECPQLSFYTATRPEGMSVCFHTETKPWQEWNRSSELIAELNDYDDVYVIRMPTQDIIANQVRLQDLQALAKATVRSGVDIADSVADTNSSSTATPSTLSFSKGDAIEYVSTDAEGQQQVQTGVVMAIHRDDVPWYYTIRLDVTGREKQTDANHLRPRDVSSSNASSKSASDPIQPTVVPTSLPTSTSSGSNHFICIDILQGNNRRSIVNLDPDSSVSQLKSRIQSEINVPHVQQKLIFKGTVLEDQNTLTQSKLTDGSKIVLFSMVKGSF